MTTQKRFRNPSKHVFNPPRLFSLSDLATVAGLGYTAIVYLQGVGCVPPAQYTFNKHLLWDPRSQTVQDFLGLVKDNTTLAGVNAFEPPISWQTPLIPEQLIPIAAVAAAAGFDGRNFYRAIDRSKVPPPDFVWGYNVLYRHTPLLDKWASLTFETKGAWNRILVLPDWVDFERKHTNLK